MSLRKSLGKLLVFFVLEMGALCGVPMTPDEIKKIMDVMNRTKIEQTVKNEDGRGGK
jgi:hypothetical protein